MVELFAAVEPSTGITDYLLTQGVLGIACLAMGIIIIYLQRKIDKKDARIEELYQLRLADSKEVSKEVTAVLEGNSQSNRILAEKIEIAKGKR